MDSYNNNLFFDNLETEKFQLYKDVDLNALFNFTYNFDLLKGIIGSLLKNQQVLQKQIEIANYVKNEKDKAIESLKNEIMEIKEKYTTKEDFLNIQEQIKKINEVYDVFDEKIKKGKYCI
jgi:hypothetical protein